MMMQQLSRHVCAVYALKRPSHAASLATRITAGSLQPSTVHNLVGKKFSTLVDFDDDLDSWPRSVQNTFFNVCPQGKKMVIERLGKLHEIKEGGWFIAIPVVDQIRFVVDMREKALNIPPQSAITKDNVHVHVSGNLYCQFVDAEKAAYGSKNPIYAVKQHAQSSMRAAIGELELDEILHARAKLNEMIKATVQESAKAWGLEIKRYEITTVSPDKFITEAMDKQAAAERHRRKKVLDAEGDKRAAELESEGVKIRMKNESEGTLIKMTNEAEAKKIKMLLEVILLSISHYMSATNLLLIYMMSSTLGRGRSKGDRNARFGSSYSHQSNSRGIEGGPCI